MHSRKEFFSSLNLPVLLREQLLVSRVPPPSDLLPPSSSSSSSSPSPPLSPDIHCKLTFVYPCCVDLHGTDAEAVYWLSCKLSSHGHTPPSRRDLDGEKGVVSLCQSSGPLFGPLEVESGGSSQRRLTLSVLGVSPTSSGWSLLGEEQQRLTVQGTCSLVVFVPVPLDATTPPQVCEPLPPISHTFKVHFTSPDIHHCLTETCDGDI